MARAAVVLFVLAVASTARADVTLGPPDPTPGPRPCLDSHGMGFENAWGQCIYGWDGVTPYDAGGVFPGLGPAPPPPHPAPTIAHVALPVGVYVSLGIAVVVGLVVIVRLARKRPD